MNSSPGQPGGGTRGRGGPVPWGTVGWIRRENATRFVGNCGVRESRHELIRVAQPLGERVVGWESRTGNREMNLSGLSHLWVG